MIMPPFKCSTATQVKYAREYLNRNPDAHFGLSEFIGNAIARRVISIWKLERSTTRRRKLKKRNVCKRP